MAGNERTSNERIDCEWSDNFIMKRKVSGNQNPNANNIFHRWGIIHYSLLATQSDGNFDYYIPTW